MVCMGVWEVQDWGGLLSGREAGLAYPCGDDAFGCMLKVCHVMPIHQIASGLFIILTIPPPTPQAFHQS